MIKRTFKAKGTEYASQLAQQNTADNGTLNRSQSTDMSHVNLFSNKIKFKNFVGKRSVSLISYNKLTPYRLGSLIAIYEYKVIIQSALWRINPFDQFGVELGKEFANALLKEDNKISDIDPEVLRKFLKLK